MEYSIDLFAGVAIGMIAFAIGFVLGRLTKIKLEEQTNGAEQTNSAANNGGEINAA